MTDKKLLELAAKAAGIDFEYDGPRHCGYYSEWRGLPQWNDWNPLTDDGDALRLAVKLHLSIYTPCNDINPTWTTRPLVRSQDRKRGVSCNEGDEVIDDPYAATRRAIVRAAAEIGASK